VRPGGRCVYATCSLDPRENDAVADAFEAWAAPGWTRAPAGEADDTGRLALEPWPFAAGTPGRHEAQRHRRTLWPHRHGTDGFYISRWRVRSLDAAPINDPIPTADRDTRRR
jgi:16S rRNA (cytosine967-C5)-methyltransferase